MLKRVMLATVILKNVDSQVYASHIAFAYRCGRECPNYDFWIATPQRWAIDSARNLLVGLCVKHDIDFIFFYDDDTFLEKNAMKKMLDIMETCPEVDVLSGHYFVRGYPFPLMGFVQDEENEFKWRNIKQEEADSTLLAPNGLIGPLKAVGCGCTLFRVSLFAKVDPTVELEKRVWFRTIMHTVTEDVFFFAKAHAQVENVGVYMAPKIIMGHELADKDIVTKDNVQAFRKRWEEESEFIQAHVIDGITHADKDNN